MCDNNSFNVVFGGGGSGGGGTISSGSNVGTGNVLVFKQVVGSDLEFRTLQDTPSILLSYVEGDIDPTLNYTIQADVDLRTIGIRVGDGWYTWYSNLQDAMSNANAGETIEFFADYRERRIGTNVILKDGVDVNLNGFTYTYLLDDETNAFETDGNSVTCTFRNGTIQRLGATQNAITKGNLFYLQLTELGGLIDIDFTDCVLSNFGGVVITTDGDFSTSVIRGGTIIGGGSIDDGVNPPLFLSSYFSGVGTLYNMTFRISEIVVLKNGCNLTNLTIYNEEVASSKGAIDVDDCVMSNCFMKSLKRNSIINGVVNNCTFISTEDTTIESQSSEFQNCSIEYLHQGGSGNEALNLDGCDVRNCYVYSSWLKSISANNSFVLNSSIVASGTDYVFNDDGGNTISNCVINNQNDSTDGNLGGIYCAVATGNSKISNNTIIISDSTSYGVAGIVSSNGFFVSNIFQGTSNLISGSVTNSQVTITDTFGNIQVG